VRALCHDVARRDQRVLAGLEARGPEQRAQLVDAAVDVADHQHAPAGAQLRGVARRQALVDDRRQGVACVCRWAAGGGAAA
jgi:hypothetical protein